MNMAESTIYLPTPKTPTHNASRDDRLRVHCLYFDAGLTVDEIRLITRLTRRQIYYSLDNRPTPQHSFKSTLLDTPHRKELIRWVTQSSFTRDIPWAELPRWLEWNCGSTAIRTAFKKEGYTRALRRRKPPISPANQALRLAWAQEHITWTEEQWDEVFWTDESWVQPGYHKRQWCTRRIGLSEVFSADCISHKWQ